MNVPTRRICTLFLLLVSLAACQPRKTSPQVLLSPDERFQVEVPAAWSNETELNDIAEIQASHRLSEMYVAVIRDYKADLYDMNLQKYAKSTQESLLEDKKGVEITPPVSLTINGHPALQYEIRAAHENTRVVYVQTLIETPRHFYQLLTWTLPSRWEKNRKTLLEIPMRFRENFSEPEPTPALPEGTSSGVV